GGGRPPQRTTPWRRACAPRARRRAGAALGQPPLTALTPAGYADLPTATSEARSSRRGPLRETRAAPLSWSPRTLSGGVRRARKGGPPLSAPWRDLRSRRDPPLHPQHIPTPSTPGGFTTRPRIPRQR